MFKVLVWYHKCFGKDSLNSCVKRVNRLVSNKKIALELRCPVQELFHSLPCLFQQSKEEGCFL